jgi:hypothetical protein
VEDNGLLCTFKEGVRNAAVQTSHPQTFKPSKPYIPIAPIAPYTTHMMVCQTLKPYIFLHQNVEKPPYKIYKGLINISKSGINGLLLYGFI